MNLLHWKKRNADATPIRAMARFRDELDRMYDRFFSDPWDVPWTGGTGMKWMPALDVVDSETEVTIKAEIPGVDAKDVDVAITGNTLVISGEKEETSEQKDEDHYLTERHFGAFRRAIELPAGIDPDRITAEQDNGVLVVKVAKLKAAKPKHVPVKPSTTERAAVPAGSR